MNRLSWKRYLNVKLKTGNLRILGVTAETACCDVNLFINGIHDIILNYL